MDKAPTSGKHGALLGDGKGGLSLGSVQGYGASYGVDVRDLDSDGVLDVVTSYGDACVTLAVTAQSPRLSFLNLLLQDEARSAFEFLGAQSQRVKRGLSSIGVS